MSCQLLCVGNELYDAVFFVSYTARRSAWKIQTFLSSINLMPCPWQSAIAKAGIWEMIAASTSLVFNLRFAR